MDYRSSRCRIPTSIPPPPSPFVLLFISYFFFLSVITYLRKRSMIYVCKIRSRKIANSRLVIQSKRKDKYKGFWGISRQVVKFQPPIRDAYSHRPRSRVRRLQCRWKLECTRYTLPDSVSFSFSHPRYCECSRVTSRNLAVIYEMTVHKYFVRKLWLRVWSTLVAPRPSPSPSRFASLLSAFVRLNCNHGRCVVRL